MAIDTEDLRRSVLGGSLTSLTVYQTPGATTAKQNRRHNIGLYRGINTTTVPFFRWIEEQDTSSTYRCEQDSDLSNKEEQDSDLDSKEEQNTSTTYRCEQDSDIGCEDQRGVSED